MKNETDKPTFESLVKNAMAWAKRRPDPIQALDFLASSGLIVPSEITALTEAKKRLSK